VDIVENTSLRKGEQVDTIWGQKCEKGTERKLKKNKDRGKIKVKRIN
jgi:hypothetical protein